MRVHRWRAWVLALATASVLGGCGGTSGSTGAPSEGKGIIGIAMPTTTSQRWVDDGKNMLSQFRLLGYRTDMQYAQDDVKKQIAQIDGMIAEHVRALVVGAVDGSQLKDVLQKAADRKIPVISYDRLIRDTPNISYYATFDNFKVGVLQARTIVQALDLDHRSRPAAVELFAGSPDDNNAVFFFNGAMSVLRAYVASGKLRVPSGQTVFGQVATPQWDGATAGNRMKRLLAGPDAGVRLDAVLSPNDGIARGIITSLKNAGYGSRARPVPVVTGQDAELDSVRLIAAGVQTETVYKDTRELAKVAVEMVDLLLNGGTPAVNDTRQYNNGVKTVPTFLLQPVNVDRANYRRILVDGGYYTPGQLGG